MSIALHYREMAAIERRLADGSRLPNQREQHIKAAEKWEILAEEAEMFNQFERRSVPRSRPTF